MGKNKLQIKIYIVVFVKKLKLLFLTGGLFVFVSHDRLHKITQRRKLDFNTCTQCMYRKSLKVMKCLTVQQLMFCLFFWYLTEIMIFFFIIDEGEIRLCDVQTGVNKVMANGWSRNH